MRFVHGLFHRALVLGSREEGQDGIEYAVVAGVVVVAVITALAAGFPGGVIDTAIAAVEGLMA